MKKFKSMFIAAAVLLPLWTGPVFAMAQRPATDGPPPPAWVQFVPFGVMFVVFYFLLIRPQLRQKKEKANLMNSIKKGEKVVTQGGFIVTVVNVSPNILDVKLNDETKAKILRSAVVDIYKEESDVKEAVVVSAS